MGTSQFNSLTGTEWKRPRLNLGAESKFNIPNLIAIQMNDYFDHFLQWNILQDKRKKVGLNAAFSSISSSIVNLPSLLIVYFLDGS